MKTNNEKPTNMAKCIRFDWAMKRLLRDKANFGVLEGFLTSLLGRPIKIKTLLESEGNRERSYNKGNRVDILAEEEDGQLILVEVQNNTEYTYFQRMIFGTSKLVTDYVRRGEGYHKVRKIYSINIVYFKLGRGDDYVYHGTTEFRGLHTGTLLDLSPFQMDKLNVDSVSALFPEYYVLRVDEFNRVAKTPLEQWIHFLKTSEIEDEMDAPGLPEAREQLKLIQMTDEELNHYYAELDDRRDLIESVNCSLEEAEFEGRLAGLIIGREEGIKEGREEGMKEGREEGREEGQREATRQLAEKMRAEGLAPDLIMKITGVQL